MGRGRRERGYRNAQATVRADRHDQLPDGLRHDRHRGPTSRWSSSRALVGGGQMTIVNRTVPLAHARVQRQADRADPRLRQREHASARPKPSSTCRYSTWRWVSEPPEDDGHRAAARGAISNHEHARDGHGRRHHRRTRRLGTSDARASRSTATDRRRRRRCAGVQGGRDPPGRGGRDQPHAGDPRASVSRSRTSSRSAATRATSRPDVRRRCS